MQTTKRRKLTTKKISQGKNVVINLSRNRPEEVLKSPFARMLIFLGIFVLFALIKDLLGASESAKSIVKLQESTSEILSVVNDTHSKTYFQPLEALEQIEQTLTENVENKGVMARLKEGIK